MITTYYPNCFAAVRVAGISANKRFLLPLTLPCDLTSIWNVHIKHIFLASNSINQNIKEFRPIQ